jgi:hypothetical protein
LDCPCPSEGREVRDTYYVEDWADYVLPEELPPPAEMARILDQELRVDVAEHICAADSAPTPW